MAIWHPHRDTHAPAPIIDSAPAESTPPAVSISEVPTDRNLGAFASLERVGKQAQYWRSMALGASRALREQSGRLEVAEAVLVIARRALDTYSNERVSLAALAGMLRYMRPDSPVTLRVPAADLVKLIEILDPPTLERTSGDLG